MKLQLVDKQHYHAILNPDANFIVGWTYPFNGPKGQYRVTSSIGPSYQQDGIAVVKSLDDAIPAFVEFYEKNPVPWEQNSSTMYLRGTMFVCLRVEQDQQGHWRAYRDDYPLLQDTKPACFASCVDAQRAADAHELDLFPDGKIVDDGFSWLPDPQIDEWRLGRYVDQDR